MPAVTRGEPFLVARGRTQPEADTKSSDIAAFSDAVTAKLRVNRSHRHSMGWVVGWKFAFPCNQGDQPFSRIISALVAPGNRVPVPKFPITTNPDLGQLTEGTRHRKGRSVETIAL
jgi:hypothetical protein